MDTDKRFGRIAANLLAVRAERRTMFPAEIFDEYGWNMLLLLFVAHANESIMSEEDLLAQVDATVPVGRRWLAHLVSSGHICRREDDEAVALTDTAITQMRLFLDTAARIHADD